MTFPFPNPIQAAGSWQTILDVTSNGVLNGYYTYTMRNVLANTAWTGSLVGSKVRLTFKSSSSDSLTVNAVTIGEKAAAGDAYDMTGVPTVITFDTGSAGFSGLSGSATKLSDEITFVLDTSKSYVVAIDIGQTAGTGSMAKHTTQTGCTAYNKVVSGDTGTADVTGYASSFGADDPVVLACLMKVEIFA